jgi:hypothetical protein
LKNNFGVRTLDFGWENSNLGLIKFEKYLNWDSNQILASGFGGLKSAPRGDFGSGNLNRFWGA